MRFAVQGGVIHTTCGLFSRRSSFHFFFVCPLIESEAIPVTVLRGTSTKRRHCSAQQTVRSTADLSKIQSTMTSCCIQGLITASRLTAAKMRDLNSSFAITPERSELSEIHPSKLVSSVMSSVWSRQQSERLERLFQ